MFAKALIGLSLLLAPLEAAESQTQTIEELRSGVGEVERSSAGLIHRSSGFVFPVTLGSSPARETTTYAPGDADVYYTLLGGGNGDAWLTLYLYPASGSLVEEAAGAATAIRERWQVKEVPAPVAMGPMPAGAREEWFEGSVAGLEVLTGYRLIRSGNWFIKARLTIPKSGGEQAKLRGQQALRAVPWAWQNVRRTALVTTPH